MNAKHIIAMGTGVVAIAVLVAFAVVENVGPKHGKKSAKAEKSTGSPKQPEQPEQPEQPKQAAAETPTEQPKQATAERTTPIIDPDVSAKVVEDLLKSKQRLAQENDELKRVCLDLRETAERLNRDLASSTTELEAESEAEPDTDELAFRLSIDEASILHIPETIDLLQIVAERSKTPAAKESYRRSIDLLQTIFHAYSGVPDEENPNDVPPEHQAEPPEQPNPDDAA